ncbi:hypothetical protein [Undibacterium flavidum]|uniref:Uncharacterized protein n=1 Tax=Undibacterium flavidum TaxID=2762297 RepID=A0ABR6YGJ0_9BURK|nr:hypothetical protein [Undibacterium flavidum]MBC3875653.1 hypothetical protein [Undibacterium flavidum]
MAITPLGSQWRWPIHILVWATTPASPVTTKERPPFMAVDQAWFDRLFVRKS